MFSLLEKGVAGLKSWWRSVHPQGNERGWVQGGTRQPSRASSLVSMLRSVESTISAPVE